MDVSPSDAHRAHAATLEDFLVGQTVAHTSCVVCAQKFEDDTSVAKLDGCVHCAHDACLPSRGIHQCNECQVESDLSLTARVLIASQCAICIDGFGSRTHAVKMPSCAHVFHATCVAKWMQRDTTCPLCRAEFDLPVNVAKIDELDLLRKNMDSFIPPSDHELHELCFVCKGGLVHECPMCVFNPKGECLVVWGECGHMCHLHCHLRLPQKTRAFCPMRSRPWQPIGLTRTVKMEEMPRKSDPLGVAWRNMPRSDAGVSNELLERMESFVPPSDAIHWCAICRNPRDTECVECQVLGTNECLATYSECGHVFHLHCYQRWSKMRQGCPIDNKPWKTVGLTRCRVRDAEEAHAHDHAQVSPIQ